MEAINVYDDEMKKKKEETTTVGEELVIDDLPSGDLNDAEPELDLSVSQLDGVGAVTQKKLETFGVTNLIDICVRGSREVSEITSVSKATCDTWVFKAQKLLEDNNLIAFKYCSNVHFWLCARRLADREVFAGEHLSSPALLTSWFVPSHEEA